MKNYYIINGGEKKELSGTSLNLSHKGIKTLSVVSDNLTHLDCCYNSLTSLSIDCPNLTILYCYNNSLTSLTLDCPELTRFDCSNNSLASLSIDCPRLITLYCYNNSLTSLTLDCPELTRLDCSNNSLASLQLDCPNLTRLSCYKNSLTSLSLDCPNLTYLYCDIPITLNGEDNIMGIDGYISKALSTHAVGDFTVMKVLDKSGNRELFVARKGNYSAHGETIEQAISDCNFKHLQATLNIDELVAQIKAKGTVCMNDYRLLTGACEAMSKAFCDEHRIGYAQEVPLPLALKLTSGRYNYGEFKKHF